MRHLIYFGFVMAMTVGWQGAAFAQDDAAAESAPAHSKTSKKAKRAKKAKAERAAAKSQQAPVLVAALEEGAPPAPEPTAEPSAAPAEAAVPAAESAATVEQVQAAPAGMTSAEATVSTTVTPTEEKKEEDKAFGVSVTLDTSFGTGGFLSDATLRSSRRSISQTVDVKPSYKFKLLGHKLSASVKASMSYEYTTPDNSTGRRWSPTDTSLGLSDGSVFKEPVTGINFNAALKWALPTSYESLNSKKQWSAVGASGGAERSVGPVDFSYTVGFTKYFNSDPNPTVTGIARASDTVLNGVGDRTEIAAGFANTEFGLSNTASVGWNITEQLSVSYSLAIVNKWGYDVVADDDQLSSVFGNTGRGQRDSLMPTLDVSYDLTGVMKDTGMELPFKLGASAGIAASHPAKTADRTGFMWPVFVQSFGANRAANNFGSIYFDLTGTY